MNQNSTPTSPSREHPQRYYALDATRAFALLLGVMFHTVWFYTDFPFNTPVKDISALVILYTTYHYCVRSTFIGKTLNGQRHPFRWSPIRVIAGRGDGAQ